MFVDLCNELAKTTSVTALTYPNPALIERLDPTVQIVTIPSASRYNLRNYWHIYQIVRNGGFDIINTHCAKASEIIYRMHRLLGVPHVATKHNPRKGRVFNKIRHVTAVSIAVANTVRHGATVIYNGITRQPLAPPQPRSGPFRILAVGRLDPIKGFDLLIDQAANIQSDFLLEIAGDGPAADQLRLQIDAAGLTHKIKLLGFCSDIPNLMARSDLVIISSHSEGFPLVLVESLNYAKVLISTPVSDAAKIISPLFLADKSDLVNKAMQIAGDYAAYREQFKTIQDSQRDRFTIAAAAASYLAFYQSVRG